MGIHFLIYYMVVYGGYIVGAGLIGLAGYSLVHSKTDIKQRRVSAIVLLLLAAIAIGLNALYLRSTDPEYQAQQQKQQTIQANKRAASLIKFPTYSYHPGNQNDAVGSTDIGTRHSTPYVLYSIADGRFKGTIYQYQPGTKPYTIREPASGSCLNESVCEQVGDSVFGKLYRITRRSGFAKAIYFAGNSQTSLVLSFKEEVTPSEATQFLQDLRETPPKDLPF